MKIKKYDIITSKLNIFNFPECKEKRFVLIGFNSTIDILSPNENEQKVILTYTVKSNDLPLHVMWECRINLTFDESLENKITEEEFLTYSDVISKIDAQIQSISDLVKMDLPLFSNQLGD